MTEFPIFNEEQLAQQASCGLSDIYTTAHVEAAMCIWEYALLRREQHDDTVYDWLCGIEGASSARMRCIDLSKDLEDSYQRALTLGYDDSFDWEFTPRWVELVMEISEKHDLVGHWIEYIGMKIYHEFESDRP